MEDFFNKHGGKLGILYAIGAFLTWVYLTFFDSDFNWWNWIIILPLNIFMSAIWPITWFWKWIFGV